MSTAGGRTGVQRVTRAARRALSDDDTSIAGLSTGAPSISGSRRGRSGRSNRGATPARDQLDEIPDVSNKNSKAYGAPEKATFAEQMDRQLGNNMATNVIAKAVYGASAPQLPTLNDASRLSTLIEEGESSVLGAGRTSEHHTRALEAQPDGETAAEPSAINLTRWAPATLLERVSGRSNPGTTSPQTTGSTPKSQGWAFWPWLQCALALLLLCSILDLYQGPLFGTKYDLVRNRDRLHYLPGFSSDISTKFGRRLDRVEQTLQNMNSGGSQYFEASEASQLDFFAVGNGASIDPYLTSPTASQVVRSDRQQELRKTSWYCSLFSCENLDQVAGIITGSPAEVLTSWDDSGFQRWCAPSTRGKLQVTVLTARELAPTQLVIEHGTRETTLLVGAAPRELELWIEIKDTEIRGRVSDAIGRLFPEIFETSTPQVEGNLDPTVNLGPHFVPVGRWTYNIHRGQAVQTFRLALPLREYGANSTKFSIRANSNWGNSDFTCLNRIRMHGRDSSGFVEMLEQDMELQ